MFLKSRLEYLRSLNSGFSVLNKIGAWIGVSDGVRRKGRHVTMNVWARPAVGARSRAIRRCKSEEGAKAQEGGCQCTVSRIMVTRCVENGPATENVSVCRLFAEHHRLRP